MADRHEIKTADVDGKLRSLSYLADKYEIDQIRLTTRYKNGERGQRLVRPVHYTKGLQMIDIDGHKMNFIQVAKKFGLNQQTVLSRYKRGVRYPDIVLPVDEFKRKMKRDGPQDIQTAIDGQQMTLGEASAEYQVKPSTVINRYKRGIRGPELVQTVKRVTSGPIVLEDGQTLSELAAKTGIDYMTLWQRYQAGKRGAELSVQPKRKRFMVDYQGRTWTLLELSRAFHVPVGTLRNRVKQGESGDNLVRPPYSPKK